MSIYTLLVINTSTEEVIVDDEFEGSKEQAETLFAGALVTYANPAISVLMVDSIQRGSLCARLANDETGAPVYINCPAPA